MKVQAAKTLSFLITGTSFYLSSLPLPFTSPSLLLSFSPLHVSAGHKPNLDVLIQEDRLCPQLVHTFNHASMDLLEWLLGILYFPPSSSPSPPLPTLSVELQMTKSSDYRIDLTERFRRSQAGVGGCRSPSRIAHVFGVRGNLKQSSERCICTGGWEQGTQESGMWGEESAEGNGEERREERGKGDERGKGEWWGKSLNELVLTFFSPLFFFFSPSPSPTFSLFPLSSFLSSSHSFYFFFI